MTIPKVSVCFPTCFQPNSLRLVLTAYRAQPFQDIEIVVADDGSGEETKQVIEEARKEASFPIKHVWQKNEGYRKARIMNHAVLHSRAPLLILSDGDWRKACNTRMDDIREGRNPTFAPPV